MPPKRTNSNFTNKKYPTPQIFQLVVGIFISINPPLIQRSTSEASPSLLHRYSIETMDYVWSIYGVCMEYLKRKNRL